MEQLQIKNDPSKLQQLLGSKLYSDKYSFISEALQNSTDAMRKIGKQDENFDVGVKTVEGEFYFYIRDYGCSFDSIEEFKRLVGTLLESSKTQNKDSTDNQELGKYGIGSIAFSAYQKSCNYTVYKNGKGFHARLEEIENKGLFIKCEDYFESDEPQGVYFELQIDKYNLTNFYNKLIEKSKYFQNIRFKFDLNFINSFRFSIKEELLNINNKFVIYKSDDFQYSTLNNNNVMHICLDQYSYPINWQELGISKIEIPIALRFNLDDFETNPTREVITIENDYKDKVLNKIKKVADWFHNKYNEQNPIIECKSMFHFRDSINTIREIVNIDEINLYFSSLKNYTNIPLNKPTYKDYTYEEITDFINFMSKTWNFHYISKYVLVNSTLRRNRNTYYFENNNIFMGKSLKRVEQEYYKSLNNKFTFYNKHDKPYPKVYEKIVDEVTGDISYLSKPCFLSYLSIKMDNYLNNEVLKESIDYKYDRFMKLKDEFESICFKNIEVPKEFLDKAKVIKESKPKIIKGNDQIFIKYPRKPQKWTNWYAIWEDKAINLLDLRKLPKLHIYGLESHRKDLEFMFINLKNRKNNLELIMVTEKTQKMIEKENPHNFIYIDNLKSKLDLMSKYATANLISVNLQKHAGVLSSTSIIKNYISTKIGEDLEKLKEFIDKYNNDILFEYPDSKQNAFLEEIFNLFKENPKLYHQEYIDLFNKLDKNLEKLEFLPLFNNKMYFIDRPDKPLEYKEAQIALKVIRDLCKYKQLRMDWGHYILDKVVEVESPVEQVIIKVSEEVEND